MCYTLFTALSLDTDTDTVIVILSDRDAFSVYLLKLDGFTVLFDNHGLSTEIKKK